MAVQDQASLSIAREYAEKYPESQRLHQEAQALLPGGVTHMARVFDPFPLYVDRCVGAHKWDVDGNRYIDYWMGHGAMLLGHAHPAVVEAVREQVARGTHAGGSTRLEIDWARLIMDLVPCAELDERRAVDRRGFADHGDEAGPCRPRCPDQDVLVQHLRHEHELMLPSQNVRPLQLALSGNGLTPHGPASTEIHGRDVCTGLARSVQVDTAAVRDAIQTPLTAVLDSIGKVLRDCPPDLVADLADRGIMMVGGSALLPGFDQMLRQATRMPVHIAERPDICAVQGLGTMLEGKIEPMELNPISS